jgi:hypothetical protein
MTSAAKTAATMMKESRLGIGPCDIEFSGVGAEGVFRIGPRSGWLQPPGPKLTPPMKLWLVISVLWTIPVVGALLFVLFAH